MLVGSGLWGSPWLSGGVLRDSENIAALGEGSMVGFREGCLFLTLKTLSRTSSENFFWTSSEKKTSTLPVSKRKA